MTNTLDTPVGELLPAHHARPERAAMERAAFSRVLELIGELITKSPNAVLEQALAATTPEGGFAELFALMVFETPVKDPWAQALMRGARRKVELLKEAHGALSAEKVGEMLGIGRAAVDKRRREGRLLGVMTPSGDYRYPAAQFSSQGTVISGLPEVLGAFRLTDPWMQLDLLLARPETLGGQTAFEALASGEIAAVKTIVASVGDQGL